MLTCPRRIGELGPWSHDENLDSWRDRSSAEGGQYCSFCGSLHPDEFMALVEAGSAVTPTDKNYKAYISRPNDHPERMRVVARMMATAPPVHRGDWMLAADANDQFGHLLAEPVEGEGYVQLGTFGPTTQAKFYYMHLSDDQKRRFLGLINAKRVTIGFPGYFYVLPYFMRHL